MLLGKTSYAFGKDHSRSDLVNSQLRQMSTSKPWHHHRFKYPSPTLQERSGLRIRKEKKWKRSTRGLKSDYLCRMFLVPVIHKTFQNIRSIKHVLRILPQHPYQSCFGFWFLDIFTANITNYCNTIMAPLRILS